MFGCVVLCFDVDSCCYVSSWSNLVDFLSRFFFFFLIFLFFFSFCFQDIYVGVQHVELVMSIEHQSPGFKNEYY